MTNEDVATSDITEDSVESAVLEDQITADIDDEVLETSAITMTGFKYFAEIEVTAHADDGLPQKYPIAVDLSPLASYFEKANYADRKLCYESSPGNWTGFHAAMLDLNGAEKLRLGIPAVISAGETETYRLYFGDAEAEPPLEDLDEIFTTRSTCDDLAEWEPLAGSWDIYGGAVRHFATNKARLLHKAESVAAVNVWARLYRAPGNASIRLDVRNNGADKGFWQGGVSVSGTNLQIHFLTNGSAYTQSVQVPFATDADKWYYYRMKAVADKLELFVGETALPDTPQVTQTSSTNETATYHGFGLAGAAGGNLYDDYYTAPAVENEPAITLGTVKFLFPDRMLTFDVTEDVVKGDVQ